MFAKPKPVAIEPLRELAEFSWCNALGLCDPARGCMNYHRVWSTIRMIELGGAVPAGQTFYTRGLEELCGLARPRILISGGADTGLTAIAAAAFEGAPAKPRFIFADICETTVAQNRLFAERAGFDAECICGDILALEVEPVDAVLAHSFLGFFDEARRAAVIASWARTLRTGGFALVLNNVAPHEGAPVRAEHFRELAERAKRIRGIAPQFGFAESELDELEEAVGTFTRNRARHRTWTEAELRQAMENAGLAVELVAFDKAKKTLGPHTRRNADDRYMRTAFKARKP